MLRRIFSFAILTLLAAGISHGKTPVEIHGRLQVSGNRIVGEKSNDTVQLTGMSLFWNNWEGQYFTKKTVDWLVDDFHCSIVRAPNGVDFSDGSVAGPGDIHNGKSMTSTVVEAASARGIYSIIDWHSHYAAKHTSDAVAYFDSMSTQYGSDPGVIFEIWNEPWANVYTWTEIKAYADPVIKAIRKHSKNLILVGTRQWSRDVDEASLDPISDPNLAYVLHFYAGSHRDTLRARGDTALAHGVALFVSEWGTTLEDGGSDGKIYPEPTLDWFKWMDSNKISSCNWSIQHKAEASAAISDKSNKTWGWDTSELTPSGKFVRDLIIARNTRYSFEPPPLDSSKLPGRIEAENAKTLTDLTNNGVGDDGTNFIGNSKVGSWAEFETTIPWQEKASMALRVGSAEKTAQVVVKVNGVVKTSLTFNGTGGWGTWGTVRTDSFPVAAGPAKIRLEWNGLFDLNWFELTGRKDTSSIPVPADTTPLSVRVEAENFVKSYKMTAEASGDSDNTQSVGYTSDSTWGEYQATLNPGRQVVALRVASETKEVTFKVKVNDTLKTTIKVPGTGNWKAWKTAVSDSFSVAGGPSKIRLEWSQDMMNVNWLEFRSRRPSASVATRSLQGFAAFLQGSRILVTLPSEGTASLVDPSGRVLLETALASGTRSIELPRALSGRLFVRLRTAQGQKTIPLIRF